jgi:UDP-N-acetylglucosamine 1-carboxyvinyltransferase
MSSVRFLVEGGQRLQGSIRPAGNKNAALPIVAAALLTEQPVRLLNVPRIRDIETLVELVRTTGADLRVDRPNALRDPRPVRCRPQISIRRMCVRIRASILLAAPLLARCGSVTLSPPGGDVIGRRRLDTHFHVLQALGATYELGEPSRSAHEAGGRRCVPR